MALMTAMPRVCSIHFLFLFALFVSPTASAQVFTGPAASAAGGGGRAAVDPGETAFLNPASIAFLQKYNVSLFYGAAKHPREGEQNFMAASLADGTQDNIVSGALSYVRKRTDLSTAVGIVSDTQQDIQAALSGFALRKFAFGVAGHRLTDQILSATAGSEYSQLNAHVGVIFVPIEMIGIGFVAYDVLPTSESVAANYRLVPTHALAFNFLPAPQFRARLDFVRPDTMNPDRRINVNVGIETTFKEMLVLRLGSFWRETADQTYLTGGFAFQGPKLSFDYSYQTDNRSPDNARHLVDLWIVL